MKKFKKFLVEATYWEISDFGENMIDKVTDWSTSKSRRQASSQFKYRMRTERGWREYDSADGRYIYKIKIDILKEEEIPEETEHYKQISIFDFLMNEDKED